MYFATANVATNASSVSMFQYNIVGGETEGELEPFIPQPELVMLAADILRQIE